MTLCIVFIRPALALSFLASLSTAWLSTIHSDWISTLHQPVRLGHGQLYSVGGKDEMSTKARPSFALYAPFAEYAWERLRGLNHEDGTPMFLDSEVVPDNFLHKSAPSGGPSSPNTSIEIKVQGLKSMSDENRIISYARYALLETTQPENQSSILPGIQVLNLVLFPNKSYELPIFGADLVSLPGNKHLVAIDFQPLRTEGLILPISFQKRLEETHNKYKHSFPWGGDIPPQAKRFFSPYALWTRIGSYPKSKETGEAASTVVADTHEAAVQVIQTHVQQAFKDYLDLYLDLVVASRFNTCEKTTSQLEQGHVAYVDYRRTNDPARPLLKRLYGEEWSEALIETVLFPESGPYT